LCSVNADIIHPFQKNLLARARIKGSGRAASGTHRFTKLYPTNPAPHNRLAEYLWFFLAFGDLPVCVFWGSGQEQRDMRRSDLVQHKEKEKGAASRTSQIVFGERQHLLRVLDSLEGTDLPIVRAQQERRSLEELIHARTRELNQINTAWDEKIGLVLSADAKPEMLEKLAKQAPEEDFYLLRLISEHPRSNAKTLQRLGRHPYAAIRENVARHPNADAATLTYLSKDRSQPLWYLVAFNPNTPSPLQRRLRDRLKRLGESHATIR
jgi:hypothetical protein